MVWVLDSNEDVKVSQSFDQIPLRFVHTATATAKEYLLSWMGSVQTYETVHIVTDGNGSGNSVIGNGLWTHFVTATAMERNSSKYTTYAFWCYHCHCHQSPYEYHHITIAIKIYFVWTDNHRNRCRCLHSVNGPLVHQDKVGNPFLSFVGSYVHWPDAS